MIFTDSIETNNLRFEYLLIPLLNIIMTAVHYTVDKYWKY